MHEESKTSQIKCVHGIKVIFLCWAVFIHTAMIYGYAVGNLEDQGAFLRSWFVMSCLRGDYVNDAFLTLSGFLNALSFTRAYDKNRGKVSWFRFYINRIFRVTPVYMIILSFYATLFPFLGSGPLWPRYATNPVCQNVWWWNLLLINNFQLPTNQCMIWAWYLANEFQLYSVSPIFLIPLSRWPKIGFFLTVIGICGSCLSNFFLTKHFDLRMDLMRIGFHLSDVKQFIDGNFEAVIKLVQKPHTRASSYLVGILLGHYIMRKSAKRSSVFLCCGWIVTLCFIWICFSALANENESLTNFAVFNGINHFLFACVIAWIVFVCSQGHADFLNRWLSWHCFVILSRLSFGAYLINFIVLEYYFFIQTEILEFSVASLLLISLCVFFWTMIAAFLVSVLIEMPISRMVSLLPAKQKLE